MERTDGEPDVVDYDTHTNEYIFMTSPIGRRSVCYDLEDLLARKKHQQENNAMDMVLPLELRF